MFVSIASLINQSFGFLYIDGRPNRDLLGFVFSARRFYVHDTRSFSKPKN